MIEEEIKIIVKVLKKLGFDDEFIGFTVAGYLYEAMIVGVEL